LSNIFSFNKNHVTRRSAGFPHPVAQNAVLSNLLSQSSQPFIIAVGDRMLLGMQDFDFAQILPKFA